MWQVPIHKKSCWCHRKSVGGSTLEPGFRRADNSVGRCQLTRIVNFVRACDYFPFHSPWGHPTTQLGDHKLAIVKASRTGTPTVSPPGTVGSSADRGVLVSAIDEWVLVKKVKVGAEYRDALNILTPGDCLDCQD